MPPKRSHEADDDKAEGQRANIIRIANPNSNDIEGHEAIGGKDDGQESDLKLNMSQKYIELGVFTN